MLELGEIVASKKSESRCVVRIRTTVYSDKKGLHIKKSLTFLRRQCVRFNILEEDCRALDAGEVVSRITNLDECEDGIYEAITCNEHRDWESGHIDDYDYQLVPFDLPEKST